jgi:acetyl/propionyl-CoA carboxylase alpha subunit
LRRALGETVVDGVPTTLGFHRWLVDEPGFTTGRYDTALVADAWGDGPRLSGVDRDLAAATVEAARAARPMPPSEASGSRSLGGTDGHRPWVRLAREEAVDRA